MEQKFAVYFLLRRAVFKESVEKSIDKLVLRLGFSM